MHHGHGYYGSRRYDPPQGFGGPPYRWRSAAENHAAQAHLEAEAAKRRAHHRHCRWASYWVTRTCNTLLNFDGARLHQEAPALIGLTAYCLDRQD